MDIIDITVLFRLGVSGTAWWYGPSDALDTEFTAVYRLSRSPVQSWHMITNDITVSMLSNSWMMTWSRYTNISNIINAIIEQDTETYIQSFCLYFSKFANHFDIKVVKMLLHYIMKCHAYSP